MADLRALVVDYGGVLTSPLQDTMRAWCEADGVDPVQFLGIMRQWLGSGSGSAGDGNPAHALERGEVAAAEFERELAGRLRTRDGRPVPADGLLRRMFAGFREQRAMIDVVRRARHGGVATALLSNSWGVAYDRSGWDALFDVVVLSADVGMRKPEPRIYLETARRLGVAPQECVFVDDLRPNVRGAAAVGMVGVLHETVDRTVAELEALLGVELSADAA